jgi:hypothetical protein
MNLEKIAQSLGDLKGLAANFDANKAQEWLTKLKSVGPEDLQKLVDMVKPIAGGQLGNTIQQLTQKVDPATLEKFKGLLASVKTEDLQKVMGNLSSEGLSGLANKAKGMLGGFLKN